MNPANTAIRVLAAGTSFLAAAYLLQTAMGYDLKKPVKDNKDSK
jgi:hypothetical protein